MDTFVRFHEFAKEIAADGGRLYKASVLERYKSDDGVMAVLRFVYDPYVTTGISDKKMDRALAMPNREILVPDASFLDLLSYLKVNNAGADNNLEVVANYYHRHIERSAEYAQTFRRIITKNLQLGVDAKTINKAVPGLIPTFGVMLANKYFDNKKAVDGKEFAITTKIDGMRCVMIKKGNDIKFMSRQGQPIDGLVELRRDAVNFLPYSICLDGELVADVGCADAYKSTMKLARSDSAEKSGLKMMVFDQLTPEELSSQTCERPYSERRSALEETFAAVAEAHCGEQMKSFSLLPVLYRGNDSSKIAELLSEQTSKGEEGIMINLCDAPYEFKRTNALLKCKLFNSCDLRVVGFDAGENRNADTLGALLLEYKGGIVRCGSGFTDEQRAEIWRDKDSYLNKIVEITYFEETSNAAGSKSLRFPVFKDFRLDKDEPNV